VAGSGHHHVVIYLHVTRGGEHVTKQYCTGGQNLASLVGTGTWKALTTKKRRKDSHNIYNTELGVTFRKEDIAQQEVLDPFFPFLLITCILTGRLKSQGVKL